MNEPTKTPPPRRRIRFGRMRGYLFTWLLSAFATMSASLFDFTKKVVAGEPHANGFVAALVFGAIAALLALPTLFLLRIVPENSTSPGVRLVRRIVFGILCGLLLGGILAGAIAASGKADATTGPMLAPLGIIFGLIAGLVDSIALDDTDGADGARRDDAESDADGPSS